jgi:membrane-bound ClpP family serine protease
MVEIHTSALNKELIDNCKSKIGEILKQINDKVVEQVKKLKDQLKQDKLKFDTSQLNKGNGDVDQWDSLKK